MPRRCWHLRASQETENSFPSDVCLVMFTKWLSLRCRWPSLPVICGRLIEMEAAAEPEELVCVDDIPEFKEEVPHPPPTQTLRPVEVATGDDGVLGIFAQEQTCHERLPAQT